MGELVYFKWYSSEIINANPDTLFVFGDNLARQGFGGQAKECRGLKNTYGLCTKRYPSMSESSFFSDRPAEVHAVKTDMMNIRKYRERGYKIGWPKSGIGTGLAELSKRSPKIFILIEEFEEELKND